MFPLFRPLTPGDTLYIISMKRYSPDDPLRVLDMQHMWQTRAHIIFAMGHYHYFLHGRNDIDWRQYLEYYPEEKMTAVLDGQKTYRIFENLIVNVTKYAMPHTRVFVDIFREEKEIVVQMKNVSKDELTFNPQEITERFVRGDESRNSEGSGLGLAIVRSFTELQGGHFHVETEADLFKAEIRWPWKNK